MKRFVVGDIHGAHKALLQCFERSEFNPETDLLISLGDVCDGWPEVHKVIDELAKLKYCKIILGNHDEWSLRWMKSGWRENIWTSQGGLATLESYGNQRASVPESHMKFLERAPLFLELGDKLFVHGGIRPGIEISRQDPELLMWDRDLLHSAVRKNKKNSMHRFGKWGDIFIGHTTTQRYQKLEPIHACNVWALDTGGGWNGKLTIMDINSYEYWQSDLVPALYPHIAGRR